MKGWFFKKMVGYDQDDDQIWETYESAAIDSMSLALQQINVKWQLGQRTLRAMSFHFLKTSKDVPLPLCHFTLLFHFFCWVDLADCSLSTLRCISLWATCLQCERKDFWLARPGILIASNCYSRSVLRAVLSAFLVVKGKGSKASWFHRWVDE